ncbi:hypothetical protein [Stutzerimonas nosocomialis]|nr:hypothetical protein [Stutzerimonas nosocomialis]
MNKTREQWAKIDPKFCADNISGAALIWLITDAQQDIAQLHRENERLNARIAELVKDRDDCLAAREHYAGLYGEALAKVAELERDADQHVPLYEAIQRAASELPDGWFIQLCVEQGGGGVELYDNGVQVEDFPSDNERLDYTVIDALEAALAASGNEAVVVGDVCGVANA